MSNSYFQFKQFRINQDRTAMKVGTDGVLLGAWADCQFADSILDIGTGTGLVALMLAQRSSAQIVALEIDKDAALQASENIHESPWPDRIAIVQDDFRFFAEQTSSRFDLIVSNPPYFENSFKAKGSSRILARHTDCLPYTDLIKGVSRLLIDKGRFTVILPIDVSKTVELNCASHFLFLSKKTTVYPSRGKNPKRVLLEFTKDPQVKSIEDELIIESAERHIYSEGFARLVENFYLKL